MKNRLFGAALDIGTTEIKGSLLDMKSKKELASGSVPNEQRGFGQDVITRLQFAVGRKEGLQELNKRTISAINKLLDKLAQKGSVDKKEIKKIVAVGNSVMYHIVLMIDPATLAQAPFLPAETKMQERSAAGMGIDASGTFKFLPNISGFVGSDTLAVILAAEIYKYSRYSLIMDIGTNGEIAMGSKDKILVASCASGPAFEGRHIRSGMPAGKGAIVGIKEAEGGLWLAVVGNGEPKGVAGSGLIDLLSMLIDKKVIDKTGRMAQKEFVMYKKAGKKISLTQEDIRQAQVAKAALSAGVEILRRKLDLAVKDINALYVTGSFGVGIDAHSAKRIGLIPAGIPDKKIYFLEEGALAGAKKVLLRPKAEKEIGAVLSKCEHVELHKDKDFQDIFAAAMGF